MKTEIKMADKSLRDYVRDVIYKTYRDAKWYSVKNLTWAVKHFPTLCRFAMIGIKTCILFGIKPSDLERYRKEVQNTDAVESADE